MLKTPRLLFQRSVNSEKFLQSALYSQAVPNLKKQNRQLLISCKRSQFNHYAGVYYGKLDEVPLASKGWTHVKSRGDVFTVNKLSEAKQPTYTFKECNIHPNLIPVLKNQGIHELTEFQYRAIKEIMLGSHVLLAAETGCGKTLSYLLPIVHRLIDDRSDKANTPKAVIIVPNRELAYQVGEVAKLLGEAVDLVAKTLVGGKTKHIMMNPEFGDVDILVATPGALGKLSTVGIYKLNEVKYTVFDEADTLIDDSFIERIEGLVKRMSQSQLLLVSATIPRTLPAVLAPYEPSIKHVISPKVHKPLLNITQKFLRLTKTSKPGNLLQLARDNKRPMLIFANKNETCNWMAMFLRENGLECANINGDMNYYIRIDQWNRFVSGKVPILAATDVGSRGLDTVQVGHVLNYDFPLYAADYLHRIGRVGRLGSDESCRVTNFVSGYPEVKLVQQIELAIRRNQPLENVDGNITNLVQRRIEKSQREVA